MYSNARILFIIQLAIYVVFATPSLGIRPDFLQPTGEDIDVDITSYSGIIRFDDGTIPLDKSRMTDAKLFHLATVAYNEMVQVWQDLKIPKASLPAAMAAFAYQDNVFFASSLRAPKNYGSLANIPKGSVREYMDNALRNDQKTHSRGGGCAEINLFELVWDANGQSDRGRGPPAPRVATIVRPGEAIGNEFNAAPCVNGQSGPGYGCHEVVQSYGVEAIDNGVKADPTGEDDWVFSLAENPRPPCEKN